MRKIQPILFVLLLMITAGSLQADHLSDRLLFSARLQGSNEVPAVTTDGNGVAALVLNATRDSLCVNVAVTALSGPVTGLHIHEGAAGTNGPVVWDLGPFRNGPRVSGSIAITAEQLVTFMQGGYYVNVHTDQNPGGEVRGQVILETDFSHYAWLDSTYNSTGATSYGLAVMNLSKDKTELNVRLITSGLTGPIQAAHFHDVGTGNVIVGLDSLINGTTLVGTVDATSFDTDALDGGFYLNVHTAAAPNGEIAGVTMIDSDALAFDVALDNVFHGNNSMGQGTAHLRLNATFDTLRYMANWDNLTGTYMAAHFHNGAGSVVHDIGPNVTGQRAMGIWVNPADADILDLLTGAAYLNVHTDSFPNGEIAGNTYRLAREGYVLNIDAAQTVPNVSGNGVGGGMVSINRGQSNAHFMLAVNNLTGPLQAAHFHLGVAGEAGPVLYTLPMADNGAYGYWSDDFTTANSLQFRRDSVYANFHTMANPSGEIRGQAMRGGPCMELSTSLEESLAERGLNIFPNPSQDHFYAELPDNFRPEAIELVDLNGRTVLRQAWQNDRVNVDQVQPGMYFIRFQEKGESIYGGKIIITE